MSFEITALLKLIFRCFITGLIFLSVEAYSAPFVYEKIAQNVNLDPDILYSIALVESGHTYNNQYGPWPWTLNIRDKAYFYSSRIEAYYALMDELDNGNRSVAIGPMQIYWRWNSDYFESPWESLDPYKNIEVGSMVLMYFLKKKSTMIEAIGAYYSPNKKDQADKYVTRVLEKMDYLKGL